MRFPTIVVRGDVLSSWLTVSDYTQTRLAAELGVSKGRVSQLMTSREEPSAHLIAKLMVLTRLPFDRLFQVIRSLPDSPATPPATTPAHAGQDSSPRPGRPERGVALVQSSS